MGLGKILRNSQNIRTYFMLNHRIRRIYDMAKPSGRYYARSEQGNTAVFNENIEEREKT